MVDPYPSEHELVRLQKDIQAMGVEVNMLILTDEKNERIKRTNPWFYNSLIRTSIVYKR